MTGKYIYGLGFSLVAVAMLLYYSGLIRADRVFTNYQTCENSTNGGRTSPNNSREDRTRQTPSPLFPAPKRLVPETCGLVMAGSSIKNAGWGVFSMIPRKNGARVHQGDPVIHITDINPLHAHGMKRVVWDYLWEGQEMGGQYEGQHVMSMIPGIGMLANGEFNQHNVLPYKPQVDDGGLIRNQSPGAGATTQYHNFTWYAQKDLEAGDEIFINYGYGWFKERGFTNQPPPTEARSLQWLRENGYCIDNLIPDRSTLDQAGRGAFASRDLEAGTIVAPVAVLPLSSASLQIIKQRESGRIVTSEQLLRNYCFGHKNSTLLLYPYSPMINLINHHREPNVRLQWSAQSAQSFDKPMEALQQTPSQLLLELVALRDIQEGEEIFLDYGRDWDDAWKSHVGSWRPSNEKYISSQTMEDVIRILRTEMEQQEDPYPDNVFTSCFYKYSDRHANDRMQQESVNSVTAFPWKWMRGIYEMRNLRPCSVLARGQDSNGETLYTVHVLNRPGLAENERIPKGRPHIVTQVPRKAIQFSDKLYTTSQHLETAFRKEIGLEMFPKQWMDLLH